MFGVDQESVLVYQEAVLVKRTVSRNHQIQTSSTYISSSSSSSVSTGGGAGGRVDFHVPPPPTRSAVPSAGTNSTWRTKATTVTSSTQRSPYTQQLYQLKVTYSSAPQKSISERVTCGGPGPPPPPLKQQHKSYSVGSQLALYNLSNQSTPNHFPTHSPLLQNQRHKQRNFANGQNIVCHRRLPCRTTEDIIKSTRLPNGYELSQDLLDKQVEVLERKYGGQTRAGHAALTIQRAFRKYCMVRKFEDITNAKSEKRLSRRFNGSEVAGTNGSVVTTNPGGQSPHSTMAPAQENMLPSRAQLQQNYAALCHELNETFETSGTGNGRPPRPVRSLSLREKRQSSPISSVSSSGSDASSIRSRHSNYSSHCMRTDEDANSGHTNNSESDYSDVGGMAEDLTSTYCQASAPTHLSFAHSHYQPGGRQSGISPLITHAMEMTMSPFSPTEMDPVSGICGTDRMLDHMMSGGHLNPNMDGSRRNSAPQTSDSNKKKIPPEIPKRVSSITSCRSHDGSKCNGDLIRSPDGGSLSSVQSSGSESSLTGSGSDRATPAGKPMDEFNNKHSDATNSILSSEHYHHSLLAEDKRLSNISENSEDSFEGPGYCSSMLNAGGFRVPLMRTPCGTPVPGSQGYYKVSEVVRKRQYRVGLNLFNKKPEKGIQYLIQRAFLENTPQTVARFLISRKGLSKQMIGEYMGNLQNSFNMEVLECFATEIDLAGMQVDVALRKFQTYFRMPGEAQKIERLVEVFSSRYCDCNRDIVSRFHNPDTIFILAFAIIMLNTDLHTPNMKPEKRMKPEDFVRNLRGVDDGMDIDINMLLGIYERIKSNEFRPGSDHVTQVMKVQQTIVGKKPSLALPHRRLVCYCRLYEVHDIHKKERQGVHQREVFLFNDLLVVTKIFSKKKNGVTYTFRQSFPLCGLHVSVFEVPHYPHGIHLSQKVDGKVALIFNARNEHDRSKFVEDLKESILEMDEMENLRIENELEKQKLVRNRTSENRDSGVADMEIPSINSNVSSDGKTVLENGGESLHRIIGNNLKRSTLSNSLLDIHEPNEKPQRRGSAGSLDSGMSVSFQSSAASLGSRDSSPHQGQVNGKLSGQKNAKMTISGSSGPSSSSLTSNPSFLGGLFGKKGRNQSRTNVKVANNTNDSTEV